MVSAPATDPRTRAEALTVAARMLRAAENVCVLTGEGISAESGIPTFREAEAGLRARYSSVELATADAFARNPKLVWQWYAMRRTMVRAAEPNSGHAAITKLSTQVGHCTVVTQNVDDLHERAGLDRLNRLHGSLMHMRCSEGCPGSTMVPEEEALDPPRCPACGALMRPDVVWFGEQLTDSMLAVARHAALACDVFLSVGTSGIVEPAASLPRMAASHGATVILVNTTMDGQPRGPSVLPVEGPARVVLPWLVGEAFGGRRARRQIE